MKNHFSLSFSCSISSFQLIVSGSPAQILSPMIQHTCSHCSQAKCSLYALPRPFPLPPSFHGIPCLHWQMFLTTCLKQGRMLPSLVNKLVSNNYCVLDQYKEMWGIVLSLKELPSCCLSSLLMSSCLPTPRTTPALPEHPPCNCGSYVSLQWLRRLTAVVWVKLGAGEVEEK